MNNSYLTVMAIEEITAGVPVTTGLPKVTASFENNFNVSSRAWYKKLPHQNLLRYLFQLIGKIFPWTFSRRPVETLGNCEHPAQSPNTLVCYTKKHLGVLVCRLLAFAPSRIQQLLGFLRMDASGDSSNPQGTLETPANPLETLVNVSGKGSKRKQEDEMQEDHRYWGEILQKELSEAEDLEDPSYEPSKSMESDSEEYRSQNDTETDLEIEEKDGVVMLKENPNQGEAPSGDKLGESQAGANEEMPLTFQTSADGSEHPINQDLESSSGKCVTLDDQAEKSEKNAMTQENVVGSASGETDMTASTDSQEQWVEVSGVSLPRSWGPEVPQVPPETNSSTTGGTTG